MEENIKGAAMKKRLVVIGDAILKKNDNFDTIAGLDSLGFTPELRTAHYEYKNDTTKSDISVDHLVFDNHPNGEIMQSINQTLKEMAWSDVSPEEEKLSYDMQCDYTLVGVPHAIGDYWVLSFTYEDIADLLTPWFSGVVDTG